MQRELIDQLIVDLSRLRDELTSAPEPDLQVDRAQWLTSILAHSPDIISIIDPGGVLLYVSRSATGSDPRLLVGRHASEFVPAAHREAWNAAVERAVETGTPQHIEVYSVRDYYWDTRIVPIRNEGEVAWLVTIGTDISARKHAERALEENRHRLKLALEASGMGQWSRDVRTNKITWDATAKRLFEWPEHDDDIDYSSFLERVHPADRDRVAANLSAAVEGGELIDIQYRMMLPSGAMRWLLGKGRVVRDTDGKATTLIGGVVDVTSGKRSEDQLQRSQKLEAIGQLAGGVAHDFNNLLVVILGNLALVKETSDTAEQLVLIDEVRRAAERAAEVTRQLLAFSRRQPLDQTMIELRVMIDDTLKLLRRLLPETIEIELIHTHANARVFGDRGQLEQVLVNLCVNARDAMPNGGKLVIESEVVLINGRFREAYPWARPGRYALVTVSDNGTGIAAEALEHVFEPFFTTKPQGTGLGLATAYGIVKRHGGLLHVYSEVGKGTTVKVYIPIADRHASEVGNKVEPPIAAGHELILLAEDEPPVRAVVKRILERAGYRVIVAEDGVRAVELFEKHKDEIGLVLLDAVMPSLSGTEALTQIRKKCPDMPAVICSGYSDALGGFADLEQSVGFLAKPYDPDELLRLLRKQIEARQHTQS